MLGILIQEACGEEAPEEKFVLLCYILLCQHPSRSGTALMTYVDGDFNVSGQTLPRRSSI